MRVFADTSGLMAVLSAGEDAHLPAVAAWEEFRSGDYLITSSYVLSELYALVQRRAGTAALRGLTNDIVPLLDVYWVDATVHDPAVEALLLANRRDLSLVDCVSFIVMRSLGLTRAFTLDPHFAEQGFEVIPEALPSA
jgi:predicted nucleic acid-binding protein